MITMDQVHVLVRHTDARYQPAVWLLVLAGLRTSELCGLRVCDIDWSGRTLTVTEVQMWVKGALVVKGPKTASGNRTIPIPEWLIDDLASHVRAMAAAGASHLQLVLDPITAESMDLVGEVLADLDR